MLTGILLGRWLSHLHDFHKPTAATDVRVNTLIDGLTGFS